MEIYKTLMKDKSIMEHVIDEQTEKENIKFLSTGVITLNLLFSGKVDGGIPIGKISQMSAPPSLGKSFVALTLVKNAQKKGMYAVFVDTENSFDFEWAKSIGIDTSQEKLLVIQNNQIEVIQRMILKISKSLEIKERRNIFVAIDSFGNLVTDKTVSDAESGKDVRDMTIPQKKNTLARLLLSTKCTIFIANHTYTNIGGWGDPMAIPGGQVLYHNCSCIVMAQTKAKETKSSSDPEITGQIVSCKVHKSRFGKEQSKLKFRIKVNGGLDIFYGILNDAIEHGCVEVPKQGWYIRPSISDDKKVREKSIYNIDFWLPLFKKTNFKKYLEDKYSFKEQELDVAKTEISEELVNE